MIRSTKRTAALYIASIAVAAPQPGSAHAQERPESSLNALFPVADHAGVDPGRRQEVRTDPATFSVDPRLGRQHVDNDPDAGAVFVWTALGSAVGYLGGFFFLSQACWDNCSPNNDDSLYGIASVASVVGFPALGAHLGGGDGRWALLGSAVGVVSGLYIASIAEGAELVFFIGTHVTATALSALR